MPALTSEAMETADQLADAFRRELRRVAIWAAEVDRREEVTVEDVHVAFRFVMKSRPDWGY